MDIRDRMVQMIEELQEVQVAIRKMAKSEGSNQVPGRSAAANVATCGVSNGGGGEQTGDGAS